MTPPGPVTFEEARRILVGWGRIYGVAYNPILTLVDACEAERARAREQTEAAEVLMRGFVDRNGQLTAERDADRKRIEALEDALKGCKEVMCLAMNFDLEDHERRRARKVYEVAAALLRKT